MLTKIVLHGDLEDFGKEWELDVHSPSEAVRAVDANSPGFLSRLQSGSYSIIVIPCDENLAEATEEDIVVITDETLELPTSNKQVLHFVPFEEGDAFSAAAWVYFYVGSSAWGTIALATIAAVVTFAAITFAIITVADMLMPTPPGMDKDKEEPPFAFNGPVNTARQGGVVPILYGGPLLVGSQVIGHTIITEDLSRLNKDGFYKLKSQAYAEIVDAVSEGEIEGFAGADLDSSIYFDDVVAKLNGKEQFEGFDAKYVTGTLIQDAEDLSLAMNPSVSSVHQVNTLVKNELGPLTRLTTDPNIGSLTMTIYIPALFKTRSSSDHVRPRKVEFAFKIKGVGNASYTTLKTYSIFGKTKTGFYKDYTFPIKPAYGTAPFSIQMQRLTQDIDDSSVHDDLYWSTWGENVTSNLAYPNTSYVVTELSSEFFSNLPTRGFLMKGLKVRIPNNYDPVNRTYSGGWNGNWLGPIDDPTLTWTNNPAWIFYDLATHPRYGLGKYLDDTLIDKWALYTIAQYCDELVDDGFDGQEPRFTCNMYLQNGGEALTVLRDLASAFRSIMFWAGELKVHQDSPSPTQAQFTPSNVIGGDFAYSGTPKHLRTTVALVTWINPEDNYKSWIEYVEDEEGIRLYGINETSITAVGCTSRGQAHRVGKYALLMNRMLTDSVTFKTGLDGTQSLPGHVVKIVDPLHNSAEESVGGRLASMTSTTAVVLDRPVTLDAGEPYHLTVTMPDMVQSAHAVTNGSGTVTPPSTITLGTALPDTPVDGAVWTLTKDSESERLYRLLSVTDQQTSDGGYYELSGVRYIPSALTEADDPGKLEPPDLPGQDTGISAPGSLRLEEGMSANSDGGVDRFIDCSWGAPAAGFVHHYQVSFTLDSGPETVVEVTDPSYQIINLQPGLYNVYVRAINVAGQVSVAVNASITILELAPIDLLSITGLELFGQGNDVIFEGKAAEFTWRLTSLTAGDLGSETFGGDTGIRDPWFRDYEVIIYDEHGVELRVDYVTDRNYIYSYDKNLEDGGPRRTIEVSVAARDIYNRKTDESYLEVYNPAPSGYSGVTIAFGIELFTVKFTPPTDNDFVGTRVHVSQLDQFIPDETTLAYEGDDTIVTVSGLGSIQYYMKLEGVDAFGASGIYSQQYGIQILSTQRIQERVAGQITESWLYQDLNARIDLIDAPTTGLTDLVAAVTSDVAENSADITTLQNTSYSTLQTFYQDEDPQLDIPPPTLGIGDLWIDTDNGDVISRWNGASWDALQSSASGNKVYYEDGAPTGHANEPASPLEGDYWIDIHDYDSDGNPDNVPYVWTGTVWVDVSQGLLTATATDVSVLSGQVNDPTSNNSAMFTAITAVDGRVDATNTAVSGNLSAIDALELTVNNATTGVAALGTRMDATDILVSANGDAVAVNITDISYLHGEITNPDTGTSTTASYLQQLNLDMYDGAGVVANNAIAAASATSNLQVTVDTKVSTYYQDEPPENNVPAPVLVDGDLWVDTNDAQHLWRWNATLTQWDDARDTSVAGTTTYIGTGIPDNNGAYEDGDLYYDEGDNFKPFRFNASVPEWVSVQDTSTTGVTTWVGQGVPVVDAKYSTGDLYFNELDSFRPYRYNTTPAWEDITGQAGIQSYYSNDKPTGGGYRDGDLWFETDQHNQVWRYDDVSADFILIRDTQIADAIAAAATAQSTANGKIVTFYADNPPSGQTIGDLWVDTNDGNSLHRYNGATWDPVQDAAIQTALDNAQVAKDTADGKVVTFYDPSPPSGQTVGDLWIDTDDGNSLHRYNGTTWDPVQDDLVVDAWNIASNAQTTADGKIVSFFQAGEPDPAGSSEGDFWVKTNEGNKLYRFTSGSWDPAQDAGIEASLNAANTAQDTADGKIVSFFRDTPPTDLESSDGDLWFDTDDGNHAHRYDPLATPDKWVSVKDQTPSGLNNYFEPDPPTGGPFLEGDMWFDTSEGNHPYYWDGNSWESVQDTAVTGVDSFYQTSPPLSGMVIGDLWFDTDDNNAVYRFTGSKGLWNRVENGEFLGVIPWVQPNKPSAVGKYEGDLWLDTDEGNKPWEFQSGAWVDISGRALALDTFTTTAAVQIEQFARIQQDGLAFAEYTMKVDVNGHIAGIGLGVSGGQSGPIRSEIVMLADRLSIGYPTTEYKATPPTQTFTLGQWVTPSQTFVEANGFPTILEDGSSEKRWPYVYKVTLAGSVSSGEPVWSQVVGFEQTYGAKFTCFLASATHPFVVGEFNVADPGDTPILVEGVIMNSAYIGNASIDNAHILDATITNAKIADLSATKITTGTLAATEYIDLVDSRFRLDGTKKRLTIRDSNYDRVELGLLSSSDYGIIVRNASNRIMFDASGLNGTYIHEATVDTLTIAGEAVTVPESDFQSAVRSIPTFVSGTAFNIASLNAGTVTGQMVNEVFVMFTAEIYHAGNNAGNWDYSTLYAYRSPSNLSPPSLTTSYRLQIASVSLRSGSNSKYGSAHVTATFTPHTGVNSVGIWAKASNSNIRITDRTLLLLGTKR